MSYVFCRFVLRYIWLVQTHALISWPNMWQWHGATWPRCSAKSFCAVQLRGTGALTAHLKRLGLAVMTIVSDLPRLCQFVAFWNSTPCCTHEDPSHCMWNTMKNWNTRRRAEIDHTVVVARSGYVDCGLTWHDAIHMRHKRRSTSVRTLRHV